MQNAIKIENLTIKINKKVILESLTFSIPKNKIFAIIGPNGGGKTTLLRTIVGLHRPYFGKILIFEKYTPENYPKGLIGYLPQKNLYNINFPAKVYDVVLMAFFPKKNFFSFITKEDKKKIDLALEKLNISKYKNDYFQDLSAGLKQRVLIARAIVNNPKILIFDEPATSLDIISQNDFYDILKDLGDSNITVIVVTHEIGILSNYVDFVIGLNRKVHFYGSPENTITKKNLEKIFGKEFSLIIHDKHCETCKYGNISL